MYGTIIGTIGADAELKMSASGTSILEFSIVENAWVGEEKATWYRCTLFGKKAESLQNYITKGKKASVFGQSYLDKWIGSAGDERTTLKCKVSDIVLQSRNEGSNSVQSTHEYQSSPRASTQQPRNTNRDGVERFEDDIPF